MANLVNITIGSDSYDIGGSYIPSIGEVIIRSDNVNPGTLYAGTTWEKIAEGETLIGAKSGDSKYALGTHGGSEDAVVVSHAHSTVSHTHTIQHTHSGDINGVAWYYLMSKNGGSASSGQQAYAASGNYSPIESAAGSYNKKSTVGGQTPTTSGGATVTVNSAGESGAGKNLPPYFVVNIWRRIA